MFFVFSPRKLCTEWENLIAELMFLGSLSLSLSLSLSRTHTYTHTLCERELVQNLSLSVPIRKKLIIPQKNE